jgi:hypothetical protein
MFTLKSSKFNPDTKLSYYANLNTGKTVRKYNVISAIIESYFIAKEQLAAFDLARTKQDLNAYKKFGVRIYS